MDKSFEQLYHKAETNQWWFSTRRSAIVKLLPKLCAGLKVLDIGCAGGLLMQDLIKQNPGIEMHGIDMSEKAIALCHQRELHHARVADATQPPYPEHYFDVIIASDCLEHLQDDTTAVKNWYKLLKPGGILLIFVPAFMQLWSEHDMVNHHFRRYSRTQLLHLCMQNNMRLIRSGYWNFLLFIPALIVRVGKNLFGGIQTNPKADAIVNPPAWMNTALTLLLKAENKVLPFGSFPFGISTFCLVQK